MLSQTQILKISFRRISKQQEIVPVKLDRQLDRVELHSGPESLFFDVHARCVLSVCVEDHVLQGLAQAGLGRQVSHVL